MKLVCLASPCIFAYYFLLMQPTFRAIGLSYHNSPLELRELIAFNEHTSKSFLRNLNSTLGIGEAMVLSTCNRTEIYYSAESNLDSNVLSLLSIEKGLEKDINLASYAKGFEFKEAIMQLYKVALGLDSKVLGDLQISNQMKKAYQWSADEGMAGPFMHRLLHSIFYANKRVVQETFFRDGTASTAYAAVEIVKQFIPNFENPKVLVLGLGEIGVNIAENIQGVSAQITVATRTDEKAQITADRLGYKWSNFSDVLEDLSEFDAIISSISAPQPVVVKSALDSKSIAQKVVIDLSLPRSVSADVEDLHHVILYNIDHLDQKTSEALKQREKSIPEVEAIMNQAVLEFDSWAQEMEVSPIIQKLKNALEEIRQKELAKHVKGASKTEMKLLDSATKGIIQKVIRLPVLQLKAACKRGDADTLVESLNDLFNLEQEEKI